MTYHVTSLPDICMSRLHTDGSPIYIKRGESGYYEAPEGTDPDEFNLLNSITPAQVSAMEAGSMFGWHVPGADPESPFNAKLTEFPYRGRNQ